MAKKMVKIFSNELSVSHIPQGGKGLYWLWEKSPYEDECYIEVEAEDFRFEMRNRIGFRRMFAEDGTLFIKDADLIKEFNLSDIDEYILTNDELTELVFNGSVDKLEEFLQYAPQSMIDNIQPICTAKELTDRKKIKLIKEYTGKDLNEFYDDAENMGEIKDGTDQVATKQPRKKKIK